MLANLTIMYSKNAKVHLIKDKELKEIDKITSTFLDEDTLRNSNIFKEKIEAFYRRYSNYSRKIENEEAKRGYIVINYINENKIEKTLNPIYSPDKDKLNIVYLTNKIERVLKQKKEKELILKIYREQSFLKTDYNYAVNNIGYCLQLINTYGVSKTTIKQYNKLIKIIKDTILINYDPSKNITPSISYFHAREIDDIINTNSSIKPANISIKDSSINLLEKGYKLKKDSLPRKDNNYHGAGDYYLDYFEEDREAKRWSKK